MQTYICKCGKTFEKSSNAATTGYVLQNFSPQHECYGCPYIVTEREWVSKEIIKRECRATPKITYRTFCHIGTDDKDYTACHLYSLDLVFVKRVLNYINSLDGAESHSHAVPDEWRAADFGQCYNSEGIFGLGIFPLFFQKNKKGTAARRDVMQRFFDDRGFRKNTTEDSEQQIVLQRIEIAKENAGNITVQKKMEEKTMNFDINSMLSAAPAASGTTSVQELPVDMLVPYSSHPFTLYTGERLDDMVQSVKQNGILTPILVRELDGRYEILAGHNRTNAAKLAGLTTVPAVVKSNISDDEAYMYVIETNAMQRGFNELKISEQAAVVSMRHTKMFDDDKLNAIRKELSSIEMGAEEVKQDSKLARVGEEYGLSKNTIARLIRINKLLTACDKYTVAVDEKKLSVRAAVELSYIPASALEVIFERYKDSIVVDNLWVDSVKIDQKLAEQLRELFKNFSGGKMSAELVLDTMQKCSEPKKPKARKLNADIYSKYFDEDESDDYVNSIIDEALKMYFQNEKE